MYVALFAVLIILLMQLRHGLWRGHLEGDIHIYFDRSNTFIATHSWKNMGFNEYPPGALWYFVFVRSVFFNPSSYLSFLSGIVFFNTILFIQHFLFFKRHAHRIAGYIFLIIALGMGPSLFFRIELLVSILTLYAWKYFRDEKYSTSALLLGLGVSVKLYPVVLLPLLLAELLRTRKFHELLPAVMYFFIGCLLPAAFYVGFGGTLAALLQHMQVQGMRLISLEGFWGTYLTILQSIKQAPLLVSAAYNDHGLTSNLPFLGRTLMSSVCFILTGLVFVNTVFQSRKQTLKDAGWAFLLLFVLVYFTKTGGPQYRWWFMVFLPYIPPEWFGKKFWYWLTISFAFLSLALGQIVYPIFYSEFLSWFYQSVPGVSPRIFVVSTLRNILQLLALLITLRCAPWMFDQKSRRKS